MQELNKELDDSQNGTCRDDEAVVVDTAVVQFEGQLTQNLSETVQEPSEELPRVTENATEASTGVQATEARILTVPGAVYRASVLPTQAEPPEETTESTVPTVPLPPVAEYYSVPVTSAAADEHAPTDADYKQAHSLDDPGSYATVYEHEGHEPISNEPHPIAVAYDPTHEQEEYERFLTEQEQKGTRARSRKRVSADEDSDSLYFPVDSIEKSVKLVEARMLYEIESMKAKHKMLGYTFSIDVLKKDRTEHKLRKQISSRMYRLSRALKCERADNVRYYTAVLDKYAGDPDKRRKNAADIESLLGRLDYVLKERERIDDSLMQLYLQNAPASEAAKEKRVAERAARAAYRSQLKTAKRVARMHAPAELKEKIFELMNERVTMLSTIERNEHLLSKKRYTGADKRTIKRKNREMKRAARHKEDDIRYFIKRAEKHQASHESGVRQLGWLIGTLLVIGAIGALYLLAKYYWRLF